MRLIGGWVRSGVFPSGQPVEMWFPTRRAAENCRNSIDPYVRFLTGPIRPVNGLLFRRKLVKHSNGGDRP